MKSKIIITSIRSLRKPAKNDSSETKNKLNIEKNKVLDIYETKAYGMVMLGYQKFWNSYKILLTPISLSVNIILEKIEQNKSEIYFNEDVVINQLSKDLSKIVNYTDYGLIVRIKNRENQYQEIFNFDNYLSAIICGLKNFGEDVDKLYALFPNRIKAYKDYQTFLYDSKDDQYVILDEAIFGYVVIAPLNIHNYQSPKYTKQINTETIELDTIIEGIKEKNFYKMATNVYNGIARFEARKINEVKGNGYIEGIEEVCLNNGGSGFTLSIDGKSIIMFCRYEKQAIRLDNILKDKFNFKDTLITLIKSSITHQVSKSLVLEDEPNIIADNNATDVFFDFDESTFTEGSPFDNEELFGNIEYKEYEPDYKTRRRKKDKIVEDTSETDFEGLLSLHSGGSIFKQFDFVDIAKYFQKFFHLKHFTFSINDNDVKLAFYTSKLPHILGIHLIDESDQTLRGQSGFEKLLNGDISYKKLKKSGKISSNKFKLIINKTESSVMIFNDIFNGRFKNISCFERDYIVDDNSKLDKLEYGITRRLTEESFHTQNLLGIGREPNTDNYFFYTSFIWKVPAYIGKKDSCKIVISR